MKKLLVISTAALLTLSSTAFAGGKSADAKAMVDAIQSGDNASIPASDIKGGWGNAVGPATGTPGADAVSLTKPNG